jgi:hypothetical protein
VKENITAKLVHCKNPQCHVLHENLDGSGYCESCWPETQYARVNGYEDHPFQPQRIKENDL